MSDLYVRIRGKVHGPFDAEKLKRLAAAGKISRDDELSRDQQKWTSAGSVKGLFPPAELIVDTPPPIPTIVPQHVAPPIAPPPQPQVVQQVLVHAPKSHGNTCGLIAATFSLLALAFCWIPFLGLLTIPLAGIAIILAGVGFVIALFRRGTGLVASIGGGIVGLMAIVISIATTGATVDATARAVETAAVSAAEKSPVSPPAELPQAIAPGAESEPAKEEPPVNPLGPHRLGDIQISFVGASVGPVPLLDFVKRETISEDDLLVVKIKVDNLSSTRKITYRSYNPKFSSVFDKCATAVDNHGNGYRRITFGASVPKGRTEDESVYPGKSVEDILVFEVPVDGIEFLRIDLPGERLGEEGVATFWLKPADIQRH